MRTFTRDAEDARVVGVAYNDTVYAFLYLAGITALSSKLVTDLTALVELAFVTRQYRDARRALRAQEQPLDITVGEEDFYEDLKRYLREATGMQFIALRERGSAGSASDKHLWCTLVTGWNRPTDEFHLYNYAKYAPFNRAVEENSPTFSPDRYSAELQTLWADNPNLKDVQSFAVFPIADSSRVIAVLSVASSCLLDFTPTFVSILGGIARSIGFTLKNRQLYFEKNDLQSSAIETATALNALELFADLTHQIRNDLTTIPEHLELINLKLKRRELPVEDIDQSEPFAAIESSHDRISDLLHQAEDVSEVPNAELERQSIKAVWTSARDIVQYRLAKYGIKARCHGDYTLDLYPILIRQVFFHLLLNSIAAFSSRRTREEKAIELYVTPPKVTSQRLSLRYVDNAGGINPAALQYSRRRKSEPLPAVEQAIFLRGVTSRDRGTGHGLWIVRQMLQRHSGSIVLTKYREGGVVFDINLPADLRAELSRRKEM